MVMDISELRRREFSVSGIQVIHQRPGYRHLDMKERQYNGFLYITGGRCIYRAGGNVIELSPGAVIYLPRGSRHTMEAVEEGLAFYRINFDLFSGGEYALFSTAPMKMTDTASPAVVAAIRSLAENSAGIGDTLLAHEKLCRILASLAEVHASAAAKKLAPAIRAIHADPSAGFDARRLASLCYLSVARFYHLFRLEYGMTPLAYRDSLLLRRAELCMLDDGLSVSETAAALGFDSVAYFSRFFKKHTGRPPSELTRRG